MVELLTAIDGKLEILYSKIKRAQDRLDEIRIDPRTSPLTLNVLKKSLKTLGIDKVLKSSVYSMKDKTIIQI